MLCEKYLNEEYLCHEWIELDENSQKIAQVNLMTKIHMGFENFLYDLLIFLLKFTYQRPRLKELAVPKIFCDIGNSIFRYKTPKRAVRALQVRKCSTNSRPRLPGRG